MNLVEHVRVHGQRRGSFGKADGARGEKMLTFLCCGVAPDYCSEMGKDGGQVSCYRDDPCEKGVRGCRTSLTLHSLCCNQRAGGKYRSQQLQKVLGLNCKRCLLLVLFNHSDTLGPKKLLPLDIRVTVSGG